MPSVIFKFTDELDEQERESVRRAIDEALLNILGFRLHRRLHQIPNHTLDDFVRIENEEPIPEAIEERD